MNNFSGNFEDMNLIDMLGMGFKITSPNMKLLCLPSLRLKSRED
jgi:hypothetical protein